MSINLIQFQQGLSMIEFMQRYGTEAKAYRASRVRHFCPGNGSLGGSR
ncbi:MAG: hypothetical protein KGL63_10440 [Betaproteobacteria bacterium]|nr:hypothetical protein [Betaproteobacteria bacterium]